MGLKETIQTEILELQDRLAILNGVSEDTFFFGTIMVFQSATGAKWHYVKTAEETWRKMSSGEQKPLADWILETRESGIGDFEVYQMSVAAIPFYATA